LLCIVHISKGLIVHFFIGALIAEAVELFDGFHLLAVVRAVGDVEDFFYSQCASRSDYVSDVVFFTYVVD
jgi:hypothetical protein